MKKHSIILYSAVIISVFALLYHLEKPDEKRKSEVNTFLKRHEGEKGIAVLKVPDFLLGELLNSDSLNFSKNSFESFRIMILHEKQNQSRTCNGTEEGLRGFLDSLKFQPVLESVGTDSARMKIFNKNITNPWKENVTIYTSDSTFFLFNFITDIDNEEVKRFSEHLSYQNIL
ncbi:MAG: hypothetical protein ACLFM7_00735 [Bacteroidales bacterium]